MYQVFDHTKINVCNKIMLMMGYIIINVCLQHARIVYLSSGEC